jgi:hypothetical protein
MMGDISKKTSLCSLSREEGVETCHSISRAVSISGRTVIGITAGGDVGKSFIADAIFNYFDDDQVKGDVPKANKMMLERRPSEAMERALSQYICHDQQPIKFTVVRKMSDYDRLPKEAGPEIVVFMHTDTALHSRLNPDVVIDIKKLQEGISHGDMPFQWGVTIPDNSDQNTSKMKDALESLHEVSNDRLQSRGVKLIPRRPGRPTISRAF